MIMIVIVIMIIMEAKAWEQCGGTVHGSPWPRAAETDFPEGNKGVPRKGGRK